MKTKITVSVLLGLITLAFIFNSSENKTELTPPSYVPDNEFMIGAMHNGRWGTEYNQDLGYNFWHVYTNAEPRTNCYPTSGDCGWPGVNNDYFDVPPDSYEVAITSIITDNRTDGLRSFMDRPKLQYLCSGQRSDYQCEQVHQDADFQAFYTYDTSVTNTINIHDVIDNSQWGGSTVKVKHCVPDNSNNAFSSGRILSGLKGNREQANKFYWYTQNDSSYKWYVMPKIRVDTTYVNNNANWNNRICSLAVLDWNGEPVKEIILKASHFRLNQSSRYSGDYTDKFYFINEQDPTYITIPLGQICPGPRKNFGDWTDPNLIKTDFKIYWYGNCEMWIDYVRVENEPAHQFLTDDVDNTWHNWFNREIDFALTGSGNNGYVPNVFYKEEFEFNMSPCIKEVNRLIKERAASTGVELYLLANFNYDLYKVHIPNANNVFPSALSMKDYLVDYTGVNDILLTAYPLEGWDENDPDYPGLLHSVNSDPSFYYSLHPYTLYNDVYDETKGILSHKEPVAVYEDWLQDRFDDHWGTFGMNFILKKMDSLSKMGMRTTLLEQAHLHWAPKHKLKEPSNEELNVMTNLGVSYGAKGILFFEQPSYGIIQEDPTYYERGILDPDHSPRDTNVYGQHKYDSVKVITARLHKWDDYIMNFDNDYTHSYIYRLERNNMISETYFRDLFTFKPGSPNPYCDEDFPDGFSAPSGLFGECKEDRYLQTATFENTSENSTNYFMIINRRCSPFINDQTDDNNGGRRQIRVLFDNSHTQLNGYNNWKFVNVANESDAYTFSKTQNNILNLGWFTPGEGRLYRMVPVLRSGGTLVSDEAVNGETFTCEDTVYNDGYNVYFKGNGNTVTFSDSATIIMDGGTFQTDSASHGPQTTKNIFQALNGHTWNGLRFNDCNVKIYNSKFEDISSPSGGSYAIGSIDCPLNDIRWNTFISTTDTAGGVSISYVSFSSFTPPDAYVMANTFTMGNSHAGAVQVQGFGGLTSGIYICRNIMTSNGNATGVFLSTITGGVIKQNTLTGFSIGINTLLSSADIYGNTISNTSTESRGIVSTGLSNMNLAPGTCLSGPYWLAGFNSIANTDGSSKNIDIDNSDYEVLDGYNTFNISDDTLAYHLFGAYWDAAYNSEIEHNCYKLMGTIISDPNSPLYDVNEYSSTPVTYDYLPYSCNYTPPTAVEIVDIGNGLYDTIPYGSAGQGGSFSSVLPPQNAAQIYDSVQIQMRHRNYSSVKNLCYELINNYPDSSQSIASLQTLYTASVFTDTSSASVNTLKTYYENLILNHGSNGALVKISAYLVLKCRVLLRQYTSAMSGFQQIINNNPYSYEGLLARWDYMATSLLIQGQGGGEGTSDNEQTINDNDDDKNPFTKEQRIIIKQSVSNAFETSRDKEQKKFEELSRQSKEGNVNSKRELQKKVALKEVIKTEQPKNVFEHLRIVNNDIHKVYVNYNGHSSKNQNIVPVSYNLYQNYPNPFNPVSTIKYDLPNDVKVVIKIYDILGREVTTLVNEFKKAGRYTSQFDGTNLASGVYFYRIEAAEFVQSKKMVLVK